MEKKDALKDAIKVMTQECRSGNFSRLIEKEDRFVVQKIDCLSNAVINYRASFITPVSEIHFVFTSEGHQ